MDTPILPQRSNHRELVLMTHGIASSTLVLRTLAGRLAREGFATRLWGYPSLFSPIEKHGRALADKLRLLAGSGQWDRVHLVGHSMGSIVARCALYELDGVCPPNLGRVVMLGPPNGGSHRATLLAPFYGWFSRPVVQLKDTHDSFVNRLPRPPAWAEVGVLAASNDHVIHLDRTHLHGQSDHRVVPGWHVGMLFRQETADQTAAFLRTGKFERAPEPAPAAQPQLTPAGASV